MQWKRACGFTVVLFLLSACHSGVSGKKLESSVMTNTPLRIPKTLHPIVGVITYTSYIGTPDHPTIDGGIINATGGMPVNQDKPIANISSQQIVKADSTESTGGIQKPFKDNWATSEKVKGLLIEASRQGKLEYVLKKTDQMHLPASVAVVPMVESNYQTTSVSPKGAAGSWQLMPATAKAYGISAQERFQFTTETDAALKLLENLHQEFGNWELAFMAYNAGSQRVINALQKNPNAKTIDELDLPLETKVYVKRIMALNKSLMNLSMQEV